MIKVGDGHDMTRDVIHEHFPSDRRWATIVRTVPRAHNADDTFEASVYAALLAHADAEADTHVDDAPTPELRAVVSGADVARCPMA